MASKHRTFFDSNASGWGLIETIVGLCCLAAIPSYSGVMVTILLVVLGISLIGDGISSIYKNSF
jgi:uncharacterized membrane protein HdeD (DUF308 family)